METEAVLTFESVDEILWCYHSNETSSAVLSHGTVKLVCSSNSFESVEQILWCYHSNETSSAVLSHGTVKLVCRDRAEGGAGGALAPPLFCKNKNKLNKK